jgi:rfaE bifunctional protein kinase chain/domain
MQTAMDLQGLLARIPEARIAVLGDFCLDVYWAMDDARAEVSVETGLHTRPVHGQRCGLGGAGNVANNLVALGVGHVAALGVVGDDPFGHEMRRLLEARGVNCDGMLCQDAGWSTAVYIKPIRNGQEENRIDFGNYNELADETGSRLIACLRDRLDTLDAVIVNQQLRHGIHTPHVQALLNGIFRACGDKLFVVDSRDLAGTYVDAVLKVNDVEAANLCGKQRQAGDTLVFDEACEAAAQLYRERGKPVFVSRGPRGCIVADDRGLHTCAGLHIVNKVDPVGAGDSMTAGLTAALATGSAPESAAIFGNFVAGVTVQKLFQTGTASPEEVLAIGRDPDYVYAPELADDPRGADYLPDTEIELIDFPAVRRPPAHAIFDHDGTISTLRQGWEAVMEPVMIKAILGERYTSADETLYARVVSRTREYIDKTTGIQTLVQMQGLVGLVREFGVVPAEAVLDAASYKAIYLDALMGLVRERLGKLERGELDVADFTLKKAPEFLQRLYDAGVQLYLASGTDQEDVIAEAEALGYAHLFEGRIYGAVGDVNIEAKRMVLERILKDIGDEPGGVVAFGDGPVEIRETRKRNGLAVGIASDEVRRYGLNPGKRSRLIRAGANMIIPDFSQLDRVLAQLGFGGKPAAADCPCS